MERCKQCIMPATVPGITFNEDGICSYCLGYQKEQYFGEKALENIIASSKNKNNRYNCIVPLSGGRDSTFVLYTAKAQYDLKVLAVSYDNEFRIDQALVNMENACKILGVDFVSVRSKRSVAQRIVKHSLQSAKRLGKSGICVACVYGYRSVAYRAADQYHAPLILWGESQQEATQDMERKAFDALMLSQSKFGKLLSMHFYLLEYYRLLQRLEFPVAGNSVLSRAAWPALKNEDAREIRLFDYVPWDREQIKKTITKELGWEKPASHTSTWRTDCMLHALVNYSFYKLFGCTKDCFGYSNMINSGQMKREEALKQEEEMISTLSENIRELLEGKIGLSRKEADRILSLSV
jgi:tRNA(Ile)-lysidine synthase TilS/MesJ